MIINAFIHSSLNVHVYTFSMYVFIACVVMDSWIHGSMNMFKHTYKYVTNV